MENNLVTVFCLTYNHREYIRTALDSILSQKTDFKYNIFIFDDASNDGTSDILLEYKEKYPEVISLYTAPRNTYKASYRKGLLQCLYNRYVTGKYVAFCEGDDYWTDTEKLQLQVEYMEHNPDCVMTAHNAILDNTETGEKILCRLRQGSRIITPGEIIFQSGGNFPTASLVMIRDVFVKDEQFPTCDVGDYPMQLYAITKGYIYYFERTMSVYRYMHSGSWSSRILNDFEKHTVHCLGMIEFLKKYDAYAEGRFHADIQKKQIWYLYDIVFLYIDMPQPEFAGQCEKLPARVTAAYNNTLTEDFCRIHSIAAGNYILNKQELDNINKYGRVLIMGNGVYAKYIERMFTQNNVSYSGNIVSAKKDDEREKERLFDFSEYDYDRDDTLIVIGINQSYESEIIPRLKKEGFEHYITPLWFTL